MSNIHNSTTGGGIMKSNITLCLIIIVLSSIFGIVYSKPTTTGLRREKRQSDQRIAELETLLALQKYGQHRLRDWGRGRELPGYGLVDFDKIGRRKKSTRFSPSSDLESESRMDRNGGGGVVERMNKKEKIRDGYWNSGSSSGDVSSSPWIYNSNSGGDEVVDLIDPIVVQQQSSKGTTNLLDQN